MKKFLITLMFPLLLVVACNNAEPERIPISEEDVPYSLLPLKVNFWTDTETATVGVPFDVYILATYRNGEMYNLPYENLFTTNEILQQTGINTFVATAPGIATVTALFTYGSGSDTKTYKQTLNIPVVEAR